MSLRVGTIMPSLRDVELWLNKDEEEVETKNVSCLVHFWSMSCPSCKINMPHLQKLRDVYSKQGLRTYAVHMPRSEADLDLEKVRLVVNEAAITEPCAIDNDHVLSDLFEVTAVPNYFLFDRNNILRRHATGNFGVRMIEQALVRLFDEAAERGETNNENVQIDGIYAH